MEAFRTAEIAAEGPGISCSIDPTEKTEDAFVDSAGAIVESGRTDRLAQHWSVLNEPETGIVSLPQPRPDQGPWWRD